MIFKISYKNLATLRVELKKVNPQTEFILGPT